MTIQSIVQHLDWMLQTSPNPQYRILHWFRTNNEWLSSLPQSPEAPDKTYQRYLIADTPNLELYVLKWGRGADSGLHGHPEKGCWMRVLSGELIEERVDGVRVLTAGDVSFSKGIDGVHRIYTTEPATTVHIYAPRALPRATNNVLR